MKTLSTYILTLLLTLTSYAQNGINYKAVIKDNLGNVVNNQSVTIQFSILKGAAQTNVYTETHNPITDDNGIVIVNIGEGTLVSGAYNTIVWSSDDHFLNVQVNIGNGLINMGTTEFKAVPYALNVTGLEALDEGNGIGWRLKGKNPLYHGNIGDFAIDFSETGMVSENGATGDFSVAFGVLTKASGNTSTAFGLSTLASGTNSTALGSGSLASGTGSFAANSSSASGDYSASFGLSTKSESQFSIATGFNNIGGGSANSWILTDPLFEIGNGFGAPSNALTVLKNGNFIIGSYQLDDTGNTLQDSRLFFNKAKSAFRAGFALNSQWDDANVGNSSVAFGGSSAASGSFSLATGFESSASGDYAIALGNGSIVNGEAALGHGRLSLASGDYALSIGDNTNASGDYAIAFGNRAEASGIGSFAVGERTLASGNASIALGKFNVDNSNALFSLGNGTSVSNRSNALTVLQDGTITAPSFDISEITNSKALITKEYFEANASSGLEALNEGNGTGFRIKSHQAQLYGNIGSQAVDISYNNTISSTAGATGNNSFAAGFSTIASGNFSTALGTQTIASGNSSTAMGSNTTASQAFSLAMGRNSVASGSFSMAGGDASIASGYNSLAIGQQNTASGSYSTSLGYKTFVGAAYATAVGRLNFNDSNALFMVGNGDVGAETRLNVFVVKNDGNVGIGNNTNPKTKLHVMSGSDATITNDSSGYVVFGNTLSSNIVMDDNEIMARNDGLSSSLYLQKDGGNLAIGDVTPNTKLHLVGGTNATLVDGSGYFAIGYENGANVVFDNNEIQARNNGSASTLFLQQQGGNVAVNGAVVHTSDRRLKKDISELHYGLRTVLNLNPVAYHWKNKPNQNHKSLGLIAQELQKVIPEVVSVESDMMQTLHVNYTELIPVLIKAIQEQQQIIESQNSKINELTAEVDELNQLEQRVNQLEQILKSSQQ